jgi:glutamate:GABA antiporter
MAELGTAFPQEGGPYVWTRLAFGRPLAAVNSVVYWISNPIWVGGSLTIVSLAALGDFLSPIGGGWRCVYSVAFIWFTIAAAIVSLRYGKWVPTIGAWARGAVLIFFEVSVIGYAARHGLHGLPGGCDRMSEGRGLSGDIIGWCLCSVLRAMSRQSVRRRG